MIRASLAHLAFRNRLLVTTIAVIGIGAIGFATLDLLHRARPMRSTPTQRHQRRDPLVSRRGPATHDRNFP